MYPGCEICGADTFAVNSRWTRILTESVRLTPCGHCHKQISNLARQCPSCRHASTPILLQAGVPDGHLPFDYRPHPSRPTQRCPACNEGSPRGSWSCQHCGHPLVDSVTAEEYRRQTDFHERVIKPAMRELASHYDARPPQAPHIQREEEIKRQARADAINRILSSGALLAVLGALARACS